MLSERHTQHELQSNCSDRNYIQSVVLNLFNTSQHFQLAPFDTQIIKQDASCNIVLHVWIGFKVCHPFRGWLHSFPVRVTLSVVGLLFVSLFSLSSSASDTLPRLRVVFVVRPHAARRNSRLRLNNESPEADVRTQRESQRREA